jgi:hypothetical protein
MSKQIVNGLKEIAPDLSAEMKAALSGGSEVVFSFDTTGSMSPCIAAVRKDVEKTCQDLFSLFPGLRIGLIAHGDYCDGQKCMSSLRLTDDQKAIARFVQGVPNTNGGDSPECYEYVLRVAQEMGWSEGVGKMLVLIGDDMPHPPDFPGAPMRLDWREELDYLKGQGVKVFPMQCLFHQYRKDENEFWKELASRAGTQLFQFAGSASFDSYSTPVFAGLVAASSGSVGYERYAASPAGTANNGMLAAKGMGEVVCHVAAASRSFDPAKVVTPEVVTWTHPK